MSVFLSPVGGAGAQFFNSNGTPLSGGKLHTYVAGTTTNETTYTSSAGNVAHANPVVLDAAGRVPGGEIWLSDSTAYKFVLKDSNDVLQATWDNLWGIGSAGGTAVQTPVIFNTTGTGSTTTFALGSAPSSENTTDVFVSGLYQQKNTYSLSGVNIVFSEAPPLNATIEVSYL